MKRVVILVLMVFLTTAVFATGQQEKTAAEEVPVNPAGVYPIVDEKVTISAFVVQSPRVEDLTTNDATIEMENKTNIHLDMIVVPQAVAKEKKQLLLASGDYPEIFLSGDFTNEDILVYGAKQGIFIPLNDLIEKYGVNVKRAEEDIPGFLNDLTAPDGKIYGIPSVDECYHCSYNPKLWINTEWLDKLGLDIPETTEEFYQVLKAFKTQDPNGNGIADEIPLSGSPKGWYSTTEHFLMNAFIFDDGATTNQEYFFQVKDGTLDFVADKPQWREGLRYMNRLFMEGLFDPAAFTQDGSQLKQIGNNSDAVILGATAAGHPGVFVNLSPDKPRHKQYTSVAPLKGPEGVRQSVVTPFKAIKGAGFVITDKCRNPEAAFRLLDFIYSFEGSMLLDVGPKGKAWDDATPGKKDFYGRQAKWEQFENFLEIDNSNWRGLGPTFRSFASVRGTKAQPQDPFAANGLETRLFIATSENYEPYAPKEVFLGNVFLSLDDIEEAAQLRLNITDYVKQSMVRFIVGDLDINADWDDYLEGLKGLNLDRYLNIYQKAYKLKMGR